MHSTPIGADGFLAMQDLAMQDLVLASIIRHLNLVRA